MTANTWWEEIDLELDRLRLLIDELAAGRREEDRLYLRAAGTRLHRLVEDIAERIIGPRRKTS